MRAIFCVAALVVAAPMLVLGTFIAAPDISQKCPYGTFGPTGEKVNGCADCPPGTRSWFGATACTPCAEGTFNTGYGNPYCESCPAGTKGVPAGSTSCATPTPDEVCRGSCLRSQCQYAGTDAITVTVEGSSDGTNVWGSDPFTEDSNLAAAAVHAGLVTAGQTKIIQVKCTAESASFPGSVSNGVTSSTWSSATRGFTFDIAPVAPGETPAPPTPQPIVAPELCYTEPCLLNRCVVQGSKLDFTVRGTSHRSIWGYQTYTDDSALSTAAVHAGILADGELGTVKVTCTGPQASYSGVTLNSITSNSFGAWQYSYSLAAGAPIPTPANENTCKDDCLRNSCVEGNGLTVVVEGTTYGHAWGTDVYTDDSSVAAAAVHAGLVQVGATASVRVTCIGAQNSFPGSTRNHYTSLSYNLPWPSSFSLAAVDELSEPVIICTASDQCVHKKCNVASQTHTVTVTGNIGANIWGVGIYSDDSPVAEAAVHAGLVNPGQTKQLRVVCTGAQNRFLGSTANGVTSLAYNQPWPFSYTLQNL